ncbi:group 1 glycosyl transferase [Listeria fleischmannii FSL S10-1203]|uniref:Group 1 glycosyl transferase n=1 Tax=Listeria fleischmannii FSL S10-1203 TaxID=1265822 RepID=W7DLA8_9LIST|nr:group 1 glycosyl transferase [Listeria fleischmannii FSL S10-1203]
MNKKKESNKTDEITIIYAGNLGIAQDLSIFLSLAERFKTLNKKVHFLVIGLWDSLSRN